jgi:hypothetical protein
LDDRDQTESVITIDRNAHELPHELASRPPRGGVDRNPIIYELLRIPLILITLFTIPEEGTVTA